MASTESRANGELTTAGLGEWKRPAVFALTMRRGTVTIALAILNARLMPCAPRPPCPVSHNFKEGTTSRPAFSRSKTFITVSVMTTRSSALRCITSRVSWPLNSSSLSVTSSITALIDSLESLAPISSTTCSRSTILLMKRRAKLSVELAIALCSGASTMTTVRPVLRSLNVETLSWSCPSCAAARLPDKVSPRLPEPPGPPCCTATLLSACLSWWYNWMAF
mmetsp:Transcript_14762/g.25708  ORF Transcript_14762/g.25708 Transcript_14762/m.25708 type:complete len:222 (+) Transcript_14762:831-1496(+)